MMSLLWRRLLLKSNNSFCFCRFIHSSSLNNFCNNVTVMHPTVPVNPTFTDSLFLEPSEEKDFIKSEKKVSLLEELPVLEDVSHIGPPIDYKSFNFAAFANNSVVLQKLVDLGVDFYYIEKTLKTLPTYLLQLDFDKHINPYIKFLLNNGVAIENQGLFFSKNPFLFQNNLDDLQVRINYLQSKKFTNNMIANILIKNPKWLNYSTVVIDDQLGFFQRSFRLKGFEVRHVAFSYPKLITCTKKSLYPKLFDFREVVGFSVEQCKSIVLKQPYAFTLEREELKKRLDFMIVDMELPLSIISADPSGLLNRPNRMSERHMFLKSLGKAQYNPKKPNYVSIKDVTHGDDANFCQRVAKTSIETYNIFLKTL